MDKNIPTLLDEELPDGGIMNDLKVLIVNDGNTDDTARGRYFKVVDGDDWVDTQNFRRLIRDLKKQDADLVLNPYDKIVQEQEDRCGLSRFPAAGRIFLLKMYAPGAGPLL